jgi:hypothetical protein
MPAAKGSARTPLGPKSGWLPIYPYIYNIQNNNVKIQLNLKISEFCYQILSLTKTVLCVYKLLLIRIGSSYHWIWTVQNTLVRYNFEMVHVGETGTKARFGGEQILMDIFVFCFIE